jgi:hypothetical protein
MPAVGNARDRVMSDVEQARLDEAFQDCRNAVAAQAIGLLTETGMRASEPLLYAPWSAVDWERTERLVHVPQVPRRRASTSRAQRTSARKRA